MSDLPELIGQFLKAVSHYLGRRQLYELTSRLPVDGGPEPEVQMERLLELRHKKCLASHLVAVAAGCSPSGSGLPSQDGLVDLLSRHGHDPADVLLLVHYICGDESGLQREPGLWAKVKTGLQAIAIKCVGKTKAPVATMTDHDASKVPPVAINPNEERDKHIYDRAVAGDGWEQIGAAVRKNTKWEPLESANSVKGAADRYADRHGKARVAKRKPGRRARRPK